MNYDNIYVASFNKNEIFSLKDFTFHEKDHEFEAGEVLKMENGGLEYAYPENKDNHLTEDQKEVFDNNKELSKLLDDVILKNCTGKIVYDVAWWAMPFNRFMRGFCNNHFEV